MSTPSLDASAPSTVPSEQGPWHRLANQARLDGRAFISGRRVDALDGATFACHSPIDGRLLCQAARGQAGDVASAP